MMGNNNRRFASCVDEDRISNLPEQLIDSVLERLPVEDAVRLSILSKKWRYKWTTMRALVFDEQFFRKFAKNGAFGRNGFIRIINKVLLLHKGPITKFHLHIPKIFLYSFEEVDQWMLHLSANGVRELVLTNSNRCYKLPSYIFSFLQLTKLKLENCFFKPPLEFEGFLNLEELELRNIGFGANMSGTQIRLPQLKSLSLHSCTNVYNFNIKTTKLLNLQVCDCPDAMLLQFLDSPCLLVASITFQKPMEISVQVEKVNLPRLRHFKIDGRFIKVLAAEKIPKLLPNAISSLNDLELLDFQLGDLDQLHGAVCLLRNSPNLRNLSIMQSEMETRADAGPALNHLESPNGLDCTWNQLQTVEITSLKGSKPELLCIKLLLAQSPSLEKFTITPSGASNVQKRLDIAKEVMQFPRASIKAKIFYLDPKPKMLHYPIYGPP